jgi:hypothetical protein
MKNRDKLWLFGTQVEEAARPLSETLSWVQVWAVQLLVAFTPPIMIEWNFQADQSWDDRGGHLDARVFVVSCLVLQKSN